MTVTFPDTDALVADVIGARPGADPGTGAEAIEVALEPDGEEPQLFSLSISAAYHLREALDAALEAPFWWEGEPDAGLLVPGVVVQVVDVVDDGDVIDLARHRSVRWDETWATARPR
ncbi:MAG TPA: hypothetical protein VNS19_22935 [Acidimicrobiales bacterium]|jgi:hypothetical protein|nr:hypothetical protein [Acidimicrobiales bacterium]